MQPILKHLHGGLARGGLEPHVHLRLGGVGHTVAAEGCLLPPHQHVPQRVAQRVVLIAKDKGPGVLVRVLELGWWWVGVSREREKGWRVSARWRDVAKSPRNCAGLKDQQTIYSLPSTYRLELLVRGWRAVLVDRHALEAGVADG